MDGWMDGRIDEYMYVEALHRLWIRYNFRYGVPIPIVQNVRTDMKFEFVFVWRGELWRVMA